MTSLLAVRLLRRGRLVSVGTVPMSNAAVGRAQQQLERHDVGLQPF